MTIEIKQENKQIFSKENILKSQAISIAFARINMIKETGMDIRKSENRETIEKSVREYGLPKETNKWILEAILTAVLAEEESKD